MTSTPRSDDNRRMVITVFTLTVTRLVVNITRRFTYPFLPALSRQLGVPLSAAQSVVALQAGVGMASPLFGPFSERYGRKLVMLAMLLLIVVAAGVGALMPRFAVFAGVMIAFGIAKMIFDPAMQAYLGDRIPYRRRGLAMGTAELSWAGALLIAAPVGGILLALSGTTVPDALMRGEFSILTPIAPGKTGLRAVFAGIALLAMLVFVLVLRLVPGDRPDPDAATAPITPWIAWRTLRSSPAALGAIAHALLFAAANEIFFINYGAWLETSFDLVLAALGTVTVVVAAAEIGGEGTVMAFADRIGKRRLTLLGSATASLSYLALPFLDFSLPLALTGVFVMFVCVEIGIVASIPLFTEVLPNARAIMMSGVIGAASGGRFLGALGGGALYALFDGDFRLIALAATVTGLLATLLLWLLVPEGED